MIHIIKLVVGLDSLEAFASWQMQERVQYNGQQANIARTRHRPSRADEILSCEGSIYRVIKGNIVCRQRILGFEEDSTPARGKHTLILMDTELIRTVVTPKKAFQGWRYLKPDAAPKDLGPYVPGITDGMSETELDLLEAGLL